MELSGVWKVAVVAAVPLVLSGCGGPEDQSVFWENEHERIELGQQLKLAEYRFETSVSGGHAELLRLQAGIREAHERLSLLQRHRDALEGEVGEFEVRNDECFRDSIAARRAKSMMLKFDTLSVNNGRTFKNVLITGVDDAGVAIRHEHGAATLRYADLSPEQCALFGLDEDAALAAEDRERREAIAYERSIDLEMDARHEKQARQSVTANREGRNRISRSLLAASSSPRETRALGQPARPFGTGSTYRRYGYRSYRPTYRYVYYYPSTPNRYCSPRTYRSVVDNRIVYPR